MGPLSALIVPFFIIILQVSGLN